MGPAGASVLKEMTKSLLIVRESGMDDQLIHFMIDPAASVCHVHSCFGLEESLIFLKSTSRERKQLPDLIVIDLDLPDRGGIELLKELQNFIRECNFMPRVIVIGSKLDEQDTEAAMVYPCVRSVVRKPVH